VLTPAGALVAGWAQAAVDAAAALEAGVNALRAVPVTGVDLNRTLRAVWSAGRRLTGPAADLYAIAAAGRRRPAAANVSGPRGPRASSRS
jgi:hypothetical protein